MNIMQSTHGKEDIESQEVERGVMHGQPSIEKLDRAFTEALICKQDTKLLEKTRQKLIKLRDNRTTWLGKDENLLRMKIDDFLSA